MPALRATGWSAAVTARAQIGKVPEVPRICRAIREGRETAGMSTLMVAKRLAVTQSQVSRWETNIEPSLSVIAAMERAFGLAKGDLLRAAGCVKSDVSVAQAIRLEPRLELKSRRALLAVFNALLDHG